MTSLGEALGTGICSQDLPPELKAATLQMTLQIEDAMAMRIQQLDWMSPATKQQALNKLHSIRNKIGYPDKWRDYSSVTHRSRRFLRQCRTRRSVREPSRVQQNLQAGGPQRMGHDSADGECRIQPADERHQLSRPAFCSRLSTTPRWTTLPTTAIPARPSVTS